MLGIASGAELAVPKDELDGIALSTHLLVIVWALAGWGAAELDSIAELMSGETKTKLQVMKKLVAAMAAGILTGLFVLAKFPEWGRFASYSVSFAAAYGGAAYIQVVWTAFAGVVTNIIQSKGVPPK